MGVVCPQCKATGDTIYTYVLADVTLFSQCFRCNHLFHHLEPDDPQIYKVLRYMADVKEQLADISMSKRAGLLKY